MKIGKKFGDKIYLEWMDALETTGWQSVESASSVLDESLCRTAGFFVSENKNFVHVTHTIGKTINNDVGTTIRIPKKWLLEVK